MVPSSRLPRGRSRLHHALVAGRSHAQRGALTLVELNSETLAPISVGDRKQLENSFRRLRGGREVVEIVDQLGERIAALFERDETADS